MIETAFPYQLAGLFEVRGNNAPLHQKPYAKECYARHDLQIYFHIRKHDVPRITSSHPVPQGQTHPAHSPTKAYGSQDSSNAVSSGLSTRSLTDT